MFGHLFKAVTQVTGTFINCVDTLTFLVLVFFCYCRKLLHTKIFHAGRDNPSWYLGVVDSEWVLCMHHQISLPLYES